MSQQGDQSAASRRNTVVIAPPEQPTFILGDTEDEQGLAGDTELAFVIDIKRLAGDLFALLPRYQQAQAGATVAKFSQTLVEDVTTTFGREAVVRNASKASRRGNVRKTTSPGTLTADAVASAAKVERLRSFAKPASGSLAPRRRGSIGSDSGAGTGLGTGSPASSFAWTPVQTFATGSKPSTSKSSVASASGAGRDDGSTASVPGHQRRDSDSLVNRHFRRASLDGSHGVARYSHLAAPAVVSLTGVEATGVPDIIDRSVGSDGSGASASRASRRHRAGSTSSSSLRRRKGSHDYPRPPTGRPKSPSGSLAVGKADDASLASASAATMRLMMSSEAVDLNSMLHILEILTVLLELKPEEAVVASTVRAALSESDPADGDLPTALCLPRRLLTLEQFTTVLMDVPKAWGAGNPTSDAVYRQLLNRARSLLELAHRVFMQVVSMLPRDYLTRQPDTCTLADLLQALVHAVPSKTDELLDAGSELAATITSKHVADLFGLFGDLCKGQELGDDSKLLLNQLRKQCWNDHAILQLCLDMHDPLTAMITIADGLDTIVQSFDWLDYKRRKQMSQSDVLATMEMLPHLSSVQLIIEVVRHLCEFRFFNEDDELKKHQTVRQLATANAVPAVEQFVSSPEAWAELWASLFRDRSEDKVKPVIVQLYDMPPDSVATWLTDQIGLIHRELRETWMVALRRARHSLVDQQVDRAMFVHLFLHHIQLTRHPKLLNACLNEGSITASLTADGLFEIIDTNGNNSLEQEEWTQAMEVLLKTSDWIVIRGGTAEQLDRLSEADLEGAKSDVRRVQHLLTRDFGHMPMSLAKFRAFIGRLRSTVSDEYHKSQLSTWLDYLCERYLIDRNKAVTEKEKQWGLAIQSSAMMLVPIAILSLGPSTAWHLIKELIKSPTLLLSAFSYYASAAAVVVYYLYLEPDGVAVLSRTELFFPIVLWLMLTCFVAADTYIDTHKDYLSALRLSELELRGTNVPNTNSPICNGQDLLTAITNFDPDKDARTGEELTLFLGAKLSETSWRQRGFFALLGLGRAVLPIIIRAGLSPGSPQIPSSYPEMAVMAAVYLASAYLLATVFTLYTAHHSATALVTNTMSQADQLTRASRQVNQRLPSLRFVDSFEHVLAWEKFYDYLQVLCASESNPALIGVLALFVLISVLMILYNAILAPSVDLVVVALSVVDIIIVTVLAMRWISVAIRYNRLITSFVDPLIRAKSRADDFTYYNPENREMKLMSRVLGDTIQSMSLTRLPIKLFGFEVTDKLYTSVLTLSLSAAATATGQLALRGFSSAT